MLIAPVFAQTAWWIPLYPFVGMALSLLWSPAVIRRTGPRPAGYVNLIMSFIAFVHALLALCVLWQQSAIDLSVSWLQVAGFEIGLTLEISSLTIAAILVITGLNFLAQLYAVGYLEMDWGWARLFSLLGLFEAGMCGLALCDSLFFSYVILEILTLGTYLLIGVWYNQPLVVTGARDAFLTKRIGDLFLLMGVLAIYPLVGSWNYDDLATWAATAEVNPTLIALIGLALLAGPMGKCAQFPLHLWLDEAMEGPYPSTILRNSVVVGTGAWVLIKLTPVLTLSPLVSAVTIAVGMVTAVGASLIAIAQIDIKRALSYSVSAYMGLVFIAVGTQQVEAAFFLLMIHALSMALLVMSTGSIVLNNITQDLTQLGGLWRRRPISGLSYLTGAAGLIALPPLGGFWALVKIADGLWSTYPLLVGVLLLVNGLTSLSLMREFCLIFTGAPQQMTVRSPENIWLITLPMTITLGLVLHAPLILLNLGLLPDWLTLNRSLAFLLVASTLVGGTVGALLYLRPGKRQPVQLPWRLVQDLLAYDFYTPRLYRTSVVFTVDVLSRLTDWVDRYFVDGIVNFVGLASLFGGETLKYSNSGQTWFYVLTITVGLAAIASFMSWGFITHLFGTLIH